MKKFFLIIQTFIEYIILKGIKLYQKTISPDHGIFKFLRPYGYCKYHPTCSEYSYLSIKKYGLFKGGFKSIKRIFRCTPWSKGGIDLP